MIETLKEGMPAKRVFEILNDLIAEHNALMEALGGVLTDGKLSYNALSDLPTIDGVEIAGSVSSSDFSLKVDNAVIRRVTDFEEVMKSYNDQREVDMQRVAVLEDLRTSDIARVVTLEGERAERVNQLNTVMNLYNTTSERASQAQQEATTARQEATEARQQLREQFGAYRESLSDEVSKGKADVLAVVNKDYVTLAQLSAGLAVKADAASTPTVAQWNTLKSDMDAKVVRAEVAAEGMTTNEAFQEVVTRLKSVIGRLNATTGTVLKQAGMSCGGSELATGICIEEIANTFTFE